MNIFLSIQNKRIILNIIKIMVSNYYYKYYSIQDLFFDVMIHFELNFVPFDYYRDNMVISFGSNRTLKVE